MDSIMQRLREEQRQTWHWQTQMLAKAHDPFLIHSYLENKSLGFRLLWRLSGGLARGSVVFIIARIGK